MEYANTQTHFDGNMYIVVSSIEDFVLFPFYTGILSHTEGLLIIHFQL